MKLKYYLRGLGIGIIFSVVILAILYSYKLSDSQIIKKARELGMVMPNEVVADEYEGSSDNPSDDGNLESINTAENNEKITSSDNSSASGDSADDEKDVSESIDNNVSENTDNKEPDTETDTTAPAEPAEVLLVVTNDMYSEAVSAALVKLGVIEDADDFNDYLEKNGYSEKIRTGEHTIKIGSTYEQIAKAICGY